MIVLLLISSAVPLEADGGAIQTFLAVYAGAALTLENFAALTKGGKLRSKFDGDLGAAGVLLALLRDNAELACALARDCAA